MISFKSEHMGNAYIQQHLLCGMYGDKKASIVEFSTKSESDKAALRAVANDWKKMGHTKVTFADDIYDDFLAFLRGKSLEEQHFFGITLQEDKFEKLKPEDILGLAKVAHVDAGRFDESEVNILDYLQTRPDSINLVKDQKYKQVGQRMLDFVKYKFKELPLVLEPTIHSEKFYLNNGFQWLSKGSDILILRR